MVKKLNFLTFLLFLFALNSFAEKNSIDSIQKILLKSKEDTTKVNLLNALSDEYSNSDFNKSLKYAEEAVKLAEKLNYKKGLSVSLNNVGNAIMSQGNYKKSIDYFIKALKVAEEIGFEYELANAYGNIGNANYWQGIYSPALENHIKALKIREKINDKKGIAGSTVCIGVVYYSQQNYDKAIDYYLKAIKIYEEINDNNGVALTLGNMGGVYMYSGKYDKAIEVFLKAHKIYEKLGNKNSIAGSLNNVGVIYYEQKNNKKALEYFLKALQTQLEIGDKLAIAGSYINISSVYLEQKQYFEAIDYLNKSLAIGYETGIKMLAKDSYKGLAGIYAAMNDYKQAYQFQNKFIAVKDSIYTEDNQKQIAEMQTKYETEKKDIEIKLLNKDKEQQKQKQKYILLGLALVVMLAGVLLFAFYTKRKANLLLAKQKTEIEHQKQIIEEKHKEISDSINYAERIQRALLASKKVLDHNLENYFILFKPKAIVSGDFYWASKLSNNNFALFTGDSTGHGVPGAIMSILNIACIKEAVSKGITSPELILNETRDLIIENLKNDGSNEGGKDGMDGNLLSFDFKNKIMYCASANNPVWIIRATDSKTKSQNLIKERIENKESAKPTLYSKNNSLELIEIKPDKMPIGKHDKDKTAFSLQTINLQNGDLIYTLTDGFADQFGGPSGKKFKYKRLQELLLCIADDSLTVQQEKLNAALENWKGNLEQVDDICIIGVRL
ncbi:MAG: tetratricopeptide repeat protein [Bacteroidota bacterium]